MHPDDSWHRLDITLDLVGTRWVSTRETWLAQTRPMSAIFQPPTFDDSTLQARTWVPLKGQEIRGDGQEGTVPRISPSPGRGTGGSISETRNPKPETRYATLRLIISPSSTPRAIFGKLLHNYQRAFYSVPFWRYVANSLTLVALTTIGAIFSSAFVAYAFARLHWPG